MKNGMFLMIGLLALGLLVSFWPARSDSSAVAGEPSAVLSAVPAVTAMESESGAEFVGSTKCKKCHLAEHKSWDKLRHGQAFETLKPGNASEAKAKHNLDPAKDYTKDATCLACHTVGFGKPGGYQMAADEEAAKKMKHLEGVGCESCHGAGGKYIDLHEEIMKSKRKYKSEEMRAAGNVLPTAEVCLECHNDKGPTFDPSVKFDFEEKKKTGVHDLTPMKQRE